MAEVQDISIDLAAERVVSFSDRGKAITYRFKSIAKESWFRFYDAISFRTERGGEGASLDPGDEKGARTDKFDSETPTVQLVNENVTSVEGYTLPGGAAFMDLPNWKERLPAGHRAHAGKQLLDVRVDDTVASDAADGFLIDPEYEIVRLKAFWGSDAPGKMLEHFGLVHRFKPVTMEQQRRVNRARSQSIVVGGSRKDLTIFPNTGRVYADIYDELIVGVEGYCYGEKNFSTIDELKAHMDTQHKVAAAMMLFRAPEAEG